MTLINRAADGQADQNQRAQRPHGWRAPASFGEEFAMACTRYTLVRALAAGLGAAGATALPLVASAQQVDQAAIQEIIVTATKREANLQDVPFSVAATSQEQQVDCGTGKLQ